MKRISEQVRYAPFLCLIAVLLLHTWVYAQPAEKKGYPRKAKAEQAKIVFDEGSWNAALAKATETHKYIFVDAYASWCGPCKLLKATTFKNQEAAAFFNRYFINLSIDMEKGEGIGLATQWQIQSYPTLLIIDAAGKPVLETVGFLKPKDLIAFGKQALAKKPE